MRQQVKVIKTQRDYDAAIVGLSALMDEDVIPGSSKEAELELLALVIESYERSKVGPVVLDLDRGRPVSHGPDRSQEGGPGALHGLAAQVSEVLAQAPPQLGHDPQT